MAVTGGDVYGRGDWTHFVSHTYTKATFTWSDLLGFPSSSYLSSSITRLMNWFKKKHEKGSHEGENDTYKMHGHPNRYLQIALLGTNLYSQHFISPSYLMRMRVCTLWIVFWGARSAEASFPFLTLQCYILLHCTAQNHYISNCTLLGILNTKCAVVTFIHGDGYGHIDFNEQSTRTLLRRISRFCFNMLGL